MKKIIRSLVIAGSILWSLSTFAHDHSDHTKHNMILYGEGEIYASHLVYKVPHNFQVILKLNLESSVKELYLREHKDHPEDEFIFLLDEMVIKDIASASFISGTISRTEASGQKVILKQNVRLEKADFSIIFFNELPLSLAADH